jgi:FKBP-type peptidyl-prolyl cis-trans isomerase SlyD
LKGLVEGLKDIKEGQKVQISVSADKAFGFYNPELVHVLRRKTIPQGDTLKVGDSIQVQSDDSQFHWFVIVTADADTVTLDANHPLAGQDLIFDIEATEVRDATPEEIAESKPAKLQRFLH